MELLSSEISFLESYRFKFSLDRNSGFHFYAGKEKLQQVRDILTKLTEGEVQIYPALVGCGGCDETVDMVHYTYEKYDEYLKNALTLGGEINYVKTKENE
jgi:hypothetical protein